jgi:hypothetical protein
LLHPHSQWLLPSSLHFMHQQQPQPTSSA